MKPFEFVKEIQIGKHDLMVDHQAEKDYNPFLINKALSYHLDCLMEANAMNSRPLLDKKLQFSYLLSAIRSRRRPFESWINHESNNDLAAVKQFFKCSEQKAHEAIRILTKKQIEEIISITNECGREK